MSETGINKNPLSTKLANFKESSPADKRRMIIDALFNNAMYIVIATAVIYIAIRVPAFLSLSSIVNIISLTVSNYR